MQQGVERGSVCAATPSGNFVCGTLHVAAGMNLDLFIAGRGTPYGLAEMPVVRAATRGGLAPLTGYDDAWDVDFKAEIAVVTGDFPQGANPEVAARLIRLVVLFNDISLRGVIPTELRKGFGFYQSKPSTAFARGPPTVLARSPAPTLRPAARASPRRRCASNYPARSQASCSRTCAAVTACALK
ncbi:fumarylacetoacetate hydrolase family protein [Variovorax sp. LT1R16]|uniref:fumarylacetoacetate hydrolase family protein n=1 Tax=Variovorax sp. LT1R16 TaxID=3443728 RepID=UPI003F44F9ED